MFFSFPILRACVVALIAAVALSSCSTDEDDNNPNPSPNRPTGTPSVPVFITPPTPGQNQAVSRDSVTISWGAATNADQYWLQVSSDSTFGLTGNTSSSSGLFNYSSKGSIGTSVNLSSFSILGLPQGTQFFTRVKAYSSTDSSAFGTVRRFYTKGNPAAPALIYPGTGADTANVPTNPLVIRVRKSSQARQFQYQVGTDVVFSTILVDETSADTAVSVTPALVPGTRYYVRVRKIGYTGNSSYTVRSFRTAL